MRRAIKRRLGIAAVVCLAGFAGNAQAGLSDTLPPDAYLDAVDRQIAQTGKGVPGRPLPCARETSEGEFKFVKFVPTDQCVRMSPPQRFRGLWRNEFEGSRCCAEPTKECSFDTAGDRIWLGFSTASQDAKANSWGALYEVEFMGRRTVHKGPYGHMGVSDHEVIVDRLLAMRVVEPAPPSPTQAEMEAEWKRCEAAGNCISIEALNALQKE